jgi:hypothetical protein
MAPLSTRHQLLHSSRLHERRREPGIPGVGAATCSSQAGAGATVRWRLAMCGGASSSHVATMMLYRR